MRLPTDEIQNLKLLALLTFLCLAMIVTSDEMSVGAQRPGVDKGSDNQEGTESRVRPVGEQPPSSTTWTKPISRAAKSR